MSIMSYSDSQTVESDIKPALTSPFKMNRHTTVRLIIGLLTMSLAFAPLSACSGDPKKRLKRKGIAFTADSFVDRAGKGHYRAVKALLDAGMDVNSVDENGDTALMRVSIADVKGTPAEMGNTPLAIVKLLLENGADVNAIDEKGQTVLKIAMFWYLDVRIDIVKLLIESGADINVRTSGGMTALVWAAREGHTDIVKLLLEKGANVDEIIDDDGMVLRRAIIYGRTELVKFLLENGADVNGGRLILGKGHLENARDWKRGEIVKLLEDYQ